MTFSVAAFPVSSNYYKLGQPATYELPPGGFWRNRFDIVHSQFVKVNVTLPAAVIAVYARRSVPPTHAQYDFHEVLDGKRIGSSPRQKRDIPEVSFIIVHHAASIRGLESL